jgi:DNA-directed RNA polymerase specialized sigma24 family protein
LARRIYHHRKQQEIDLVEYLTLSESSAFLAFVDLGGDVKKPMEFAWEAREAEMVKSATAFLRRDLQEKGSESHDVFRRNTCRQDGSLNETARWDAWNPKNIEERAEREQVRDKLDQLLPELQQVLRPNDVQLLVWHYVEGKTWRDIVAINGGNKGTVCMGIMRAKRRAAKALGERWLQRWRDAILAA